MTKRVFIITGESSGELYGALLSRRLKQLYEDIELYGIGGSRMENEGVKLFGHITGAFGLTETLSHVGILKKNYNTVKEKLSQLSPQTVILIDFPDFNLKVAELAKASGSKVLYYVSPQVWAWRKKRIKKIKRLCDRIAVILPFEEEFYRKRGIEAEFVGHPIMEEIGAIKGSKGYIREELGLSPRGRVLALLPGSRRSELKRLLPLYNRVARGLKQKYRDLQYVIPFAPNLDENEFLSQLNPLKETGTVVLKGRATEALSAADSALIASGTATLQAALIGTPMVVVYKLFPLTYLIGRVVVDVKFISLVNLLLQKEVVKEMIQWDATPERVVKELEKTLNDDNTIEYMQKAFRKIRQMYQNRNASLRVAEMVGEMTGW
jgi:lipid-A-disaccharide synthase